jgi:hypothetical protein
VFVTVAPPHPDPSAMMFPLETESVAVPLPIETDTVAAEEL